MATTLLYGHVTEKIIGCFYEVHSELGHGFLERVYVSSLLIAMRQAGLTCESDRQVDVRFRNQSVGFYRMDLLVEESVIVEVKAKTMILKEHEAQLLNYLKATGCRVGLLLNFGVRADFRRRIS